MQIIYRKHLMLFNTIRASDESPYNDTCSAIKKETEGIDKTQRESNSNSHSQV